MTDDIKPFEYEDWAGEALKARLEAAELVCVLFSWTAARFENDHDKALHELWHEWQQLPGVSTRPADHPELSRERIAELARRRDETRARAGGQRERVFPVITLIGESIGTIGGARTPCDDPTATRNSRTGECRCVICARCGHHTGNSHQGHYWASCKVDPERREFHLCCPEPFGCELEDKGRQPDGKLCDCPEWHVGHIHTPRGLQPVEDDPEDGDHA